MPSKIQNFNEFALEKYFSSANSFVSLADKIKKQLKESTTFFVVVKRHQLKNADVVYYKKEKRYQLEIFVQNTEDGNNFHAFCETTKSVEYPGQITQEEEITYWVHQDNTYPKTWIESAGNFSILTTEGSPHFSLIRIWLILKMKKMGIFEDIIMRNDPHQRGKTIGKRSGII